jgi:hypothetical protein
MAKSKWMEGADNSASDYQRRELKKAATASFYENTAVKGVAQPGVQENQPSGLSRRENIDAWSGRARVNSRDAQRGDAGGHPKARDGSTGRQPSGTDRGPQGRLK